MKILFYDTKKYDRESFDKIIPEYKDIQIEYAEEDISERTAKYAKGYDAICAFVSSDVSEKVLKILKECGVKLVLMRCAGYNNVDVGAAKKYGITVLRVPGYSPEAVAEHAMALALASNRHIHKAYIKVRENNFSLVGLTGINFYGKIAGIIGTGKIGAAMCRICRGFGMKVMAYSRSQEKKDPNFRILEYASIDDILANSDIVTMHCPLNEDSKYMCNKEFFKKMKKDALFINTSRGNVVDEEALAWALNNDIIAHAAVDVVSKEPMEKDNVLLKAKNIIITPHIAWAPIEARTRLIKIVSKNLQKWVAGTPINVIE